METMKSKDLEACLVSLPPMVDGFVVGPLFLIEDAVVEWHSLGLRARSDRSQTSNLVNSNRTLCSARAASKMGDKSEGIGWMHATKSFTIKSCEIMAEARGLRLQN